MSKESEWLSLKEVSELLRISKETLYKLVYKKKIPCIKVGRQYRFNKNIIDLWLKKGTFE
jgi:excisionase family DNA binding protein